jgi:hypothetical protein
MSERGFMKTSVKFSLIAVALVVTALCLSVPAKAATVSIGLQEGGGIVTVASSATGTASVTGLLFGTFTVNNVSGSGNPPLSGVDLLDSNSLNISSATGGTINVFVTSQGNVGTGAPTAYLSSFTSNLVNAGWTIEEKTFVDVGNGLYTGTLLADHTFTGIGTATSLNNGPTSALYSVTTEYIVTSNGTGQSGNSTIDISAPEPSTFLLLGAGLLGFGLLVRRNRLSTEQ